MIWQDRYGAADGRSAIRARAARRSHLADERSVPTGSRSAGCSTPTRRWAYDVPKRVLDLTVASAALVVFAPVIVGAAAVIKLTSPGPVVYRAVRVGRGGQRFTMLKLRTMYTGADHRAQREFNRRELLGQLDGVEEFTIRSDPRITRPGRLLRMTSIDELPQLVNVIRGEMSLVGPRPSFEWEVELFDRRFRRRLDVLPGVTGLWQVSGRRTIDMPGMLELDLAYVDSRSLLGDLVILAKTIPAVAKSTGAS